MSSFLTYRCDRCHETYDTSERAGYHRDDWVKVLNHNTTQFDLCGTCTVLHERFLRGEYVPPVGYRNPWTPSIAAGVVQGDARLDTPQGGRIQRLSDGFIAWGMIDADP